MDAGDWDERYGATALVWSAGPNRWVEELLADLPPGRAIDLAAGEGRNALWLAGRGWDAVATDFSPVGIERARQRATALPEGARFRAEVADATAPVPEPLARPPYDVALLCFLQLPGDQLRTALGHAVDALAPGGLLVVVGHALVNLTEGTGGPSDPAVLYDPEVVAAALADLDVVVEQAEVRRRPVEGADRPALDTVVTARKRR